MCSFTDMHIFKNTLSHINSDENDARIITGTLTAPPLHDAKQNSIKLTDTSELTPTQSTQEIKFSANHHSGRCSTDAFDQRF